MGVHHVGVGAGEGELQGGQGVAPGPPSRVPVIDRDVDLAGGAQGSDLVGHEHAEGRTLGRRVHVGDDQDAEPVGGHR